MQRRQFIAKSGLVLGALAAAGPVLARRAGRPAGDSPPMPATLNLSDWNEVRAQFNLDPALIHMAGFYLASHPKTVRDAIERHRQALDKNPIGYQHEHVLDFEMATLKAAGDYLGVRPGDIALTGSTTAGLTILYSTIKLGAGQEILTTTHDHYATWRNLELRAKSTGAKVRSVPLYIRPSSTSTQEILSSLTANIAPETRIVAVTWVHSGTGVKLPLRAMADEIAKVNRDRGEDSRVIFCVDGVHGLGIEDIELPELGCDFFAAGTHKWMFGPRGTGILWGRPESQELVGPMIPPFVPWSFARDHPDQSPPWGMTVSPGGFHAFEHRWALAEAFRLHQQIGKPRIARRIHELNRQLKEGLSKMLHVTLHTPMSDDLSAGIVCFEVAGLTPEVVVDRLAAGNIVASVSPYTVKYARLAPSLLVSPDQVEQTLRAMRALG